MPLKRPDMNSVSQPALTPQVIFNPIRALPKNLFLYFLIGATALGGVLTRNFNETVGAFFLALFAGGFAWFFLLEIRLRYLRMKVNMQQLGTRYLRDFIGAEPRYIDTEAFQAGFAMTASGIAYHDKNIYAMQRGKAVKIPLRLVRSWQTTVKGYEQLHVAGGGITTGTITAHTQANLANKTARNAARRASGLFLEVADINYPSWQFCTTNTKVLQRWHEILTQASEGKI